MAYGTELMFVFTHEQLERRARERAERTLETGTDEQRGWAREVIEMLDVDWDTLDHDAQRERLYDTDNWSVTEDEERRLVEVHLELVRERFDPDAYVRDKRYIVAMTPAGPREFAGFVNELAGPEDGPWIPGISILSRYFPVWVDWREAHGGSGGPIIFNPETQEMIAMARAAISQVIPEIEDAPVAVVFCHY